MSQTKNFDSLIKFDGLEAGFNWFFMIMLSFMAIFLLPRQFQVSVVENIKERHVKHAIWMFPLYYYLTLNVPLAIWGSFRSIHPSLRPGSFVLMIYSTASTSFRQATLEPKIFSFLKTQFLFHHYI